MVQGSCLVFWLESARVSAPNMFVSTHASSLHSRDRPASVGGGAIRPPLHSAAGIDSAAETPFDHQNLDTAAPDSKEDAAASDSQPAGADLPFDHQNRGRTPPAARAPPGSLKRPYTLHPTPYTLHPTPYTLHPTPCTLHPTPYTLHPYTLHPTPYTLHPTPYTLQPTPPNPQPTFLNPKPSTRPDPGQYSLKNNLVILPLLPLLFHSQA